MLLVGDLYNLDEDASRMKILCEQRSKLGVHRVISGGVIETGTWSINA
jgi:hypothetical protein